MLAVKIILILIVLSGSALFMEVVYIVWEYTKAAETIKTKPVSFPKAEVRFRLFWGTALFITGGIGGIIMKILGAM